MQLNTRKGTRGFNKSICIIFTRSSFRGMADTHQHVPGLDDDEHVIYAESEEQEWDEVVKGAEAKSECTAEPVRCEHGEQHGEQAHDGEVHLHRD